MSNPIGERNLLFGMLAVQKDILGGDAFVAVMKAWSAAKEKGLAQILREQNVITENDHAVLEELVDQHLAHHDNDVHECLRAFTLTGPARQGLEQISDPDVQAGLAQISATPIVTVAPEPEVAAVPAAKVVELIVPTEPMVAKMPTPQKVAKPKAPTEQEPSRVPAWVLIAGGAAVGIIIAVLAATAVAVAVLFTLVPRPVNNNPGGPIVQEKPDNGNPMAPDQGPPERDPKDDPVAIQPPEKDPKDDPIVVAPPIKDPKDDPVTVKPPSGPTPGFVSLFNGKDLTGWRPGSISPGKWRVENGILTGSTLGKQSGRLYTDRPLAPDFHLRVEARLSGKHTGRIYVRCQDDVLLGYQATISGAAQDGIRLGDLSSEVPGRSTQLPCLAQPLIPHDQWFILEIIAEAKRLIVKVDGKVTTDIEDANTLTPGHIVLYHFGQSTIEFRRIEIKELNVAAAPPPPPLVPAAGFVSLFNGKDLTGWKANKQRPGNWRIENGVLLGNAAGKNGGMLYTDRPRTRDFHLRVEAKISDFGSGYVRFRCADGSIVGYEAVINSTVPPVPKTGSLRAVIPGRTFGLVDLNKTPVPAEQWFLLEIIARGEHLVVKVDGQVTADVIDRNVLPGDGHIVLASANATIAFRRVEIKEFNNVVAAPPLAPAEGFVPLFNGKDLTGWRSPPKQPGDWRVKDGILIGAGAPFDGLYTTRSDYKNFHLRMEARINDGGRGAVFSRGPFGPMTPPVNPLRPIGFQAHIDNTNNLPNRTGSLTLRKPNGVTTLGYQSFLPPGAWFTLEVLAQDNRVTIKVNGKTAASLLDKDQQFTSGAIALFLEKPGSVMEFRKIEIKEQQFAAAPPPPPVDGFVPLFNGKDLTGWKPHSQQPGEWRVVNGVLTGFSKGNGHLFTTRDDYRDFHLRVEARAKEGKAGGVRFRYSLDLQGYETTLNSRSGGMIHIRKGGEPIRNLGQLLTLPPSEWTTLEIIAQGNRLQLKVNGKTTVDAVDEKNAFTNGRICLYDFKESIEFRRIEIKEFNLAAVVPQPPPVPAGDFVPLFNGKDLAGWKSGGPQPRDWQVNNGVLTGSGPNLKMLYMPRDDYGDFHLRAEVRINDDGFSSLAFRYPYGPAEIEKLQIGGYAVRVNGQANDLSKTGSLMVYEKIGMRHVVPKQPLVAAGQWFNLEIIARGNLVITKLNGQQPIGFLNPKTHLMGGRIILEANATNRQTVVEYRKIEIKEFKAVPAPELPPPERPLGDFASVLGGKDLAGWRVEGNDGWKANENGELVGQGPDTALISKRGDYRSFIAKIEFLASADADAFFAFRQTADPDGKAKLKGLTSRLTGDGVLVRAGYAGADGSKLESGNKQIQFQPGEWVTLEFHVKQDGFRILANGKTTGGLNYGPDIHPPGAIGLHIAKGTVRIRKFEISAEAPAAPPPMFAAGDFVPLFNGKDLAGWQPHLNTAGNWRVEKGVLTGAGEEAAILHTTRADFKDFHLCMEARFTVPADADSSGVLFRSLFGRVGYETVFTDGKFTGGLYLNGKDFGKPIAAKFPANIQSGDWFTLDLFAKGNRLSVKVNDKDTTDFVDDENLFRSGHVALRQGAGAKVEFRKIEISELKPIVAVAPPLPPVDPPIEKGGKAGFTALFNGKDTTGWQPHAKRPGNWRVDNGILIGSAPVGGSLYSTRSDYTDFHLRAEVRINDKGFGRIFSRAAYDPTKIPFKVIGYEVLLNQRPVGDKTGTLTATSLLTTNRTPAGESPAPAGEWFALDVLAKGDLVTVKVNGTVVAEFRDEKRQFARSGHVVLHQDANAVIEFRQVEIEDLVARKAGPE